MFICFLIRALLVLNDQGHYLKLFSYCFHQSQNTGKNQRILFNYFAESYILI